MSCVTLGCPPPSDTQFHCAACHQTFATRTMFDDHQDVDYTRIPAVACREPGHELGAVRGPDGAWYTPEGLRGRERRCAQVAGWRHD